MNIVRICWEQQKETKAVSNLTNPNVMQFFSFFIIIIETKPIFIKQYRLPELQKEEVNKQLKEMEDNGMIEQCNSEENRKFRLVVALENISPSL